MTDSRPTRVEFGCPVCRGVPASRGELRLVHVRNLYEDSHEGYALFACRECRQAFLEQFQEITWLPGGEDHIWLRWMPITAQERTQIEAMIPEVTEDYEHASYLAKLMRTRGRLVRDPEGRFGWFEEPFDAGNLYGP
jgi:hypothetical protein